MIAIGGAIGTGLIIGTGTALATAGPASILISYCLVGVLVYVVMAALGEMATWLPVAGGFANYASRYVDPALGFSLGYSMLEEKRMHLEQENTDAHLSLLVQIHNYNSQSIDCCRHSHIVLGAGRKSQSWCLYCNIPRTIAAQISHLHMTNKHDYRWSLLS
jgi:amino acid permease